MAVACMFLEIIIAILLGVLSGIFTGIIPGLHINAVAVWLVSLSLSIDVLLSAVFLITLSVTHTFTDFFPAVFLGIPDSDTALTLLPAHQLVLQGRGYDALRLSLVGGLFGLLLAFLLVPIAFFLYTLADKLPFLFISFLLLWLLMLTFLREKKKLFACITIILSGILGGLTLSHPLNQPLLPLFSGLFGVSALLWNRQTHFPKQFFSHHFSLPRKFIQHTFSGGVLGLLLNIFPAIGASQSASLLSLFSKNNPTSYLLLSGAINTVSMLLSVVSLFAVAKGRNGSIEVIGELITLDIFTLLILLGSVLIALPFICSSVLLLSRTISLFIKIPYKWLSLAVLIFLVGMVFALDGIIGVLVLISASALGLYSQSIGLTRNLHMAVLMLPVIFFAL